MPLPNDYSELMSALDRGLLEHLRQGMDVELENQAWKLATELAGNDKITCACYARYQSFTRDHGLAAFPIDEVRISIFFLARGKRWPISELTVCANALGKLAHDTATLYPSQRTAVLWSTLLSSVVQETTYERFRQPPTGGSDNFLDRMLDTAHLSRLASTTADAVWGQVSYRIGLDNGKTAFVDAGRLDQFLRAAHELTSSYCQLEADLRQIDQEFEAKRQELVAMGLIPPPLP